MLLPGLVGGPVVRKEEHQFIDRAADLRGAKKQGASLAAVVETEGVQGAWTRTERLHLAPVQPSDTLEHAILAFAAIWRLADRDIEDGIGRAVGGFVDRRPKAGPVVARQFAAVLDRLQAATLRPVANRRAPSDMTDFRTVSVI